MQNLAEVHCWGQLVGALAYDPNNKISTFEYAPEWLKQGVELAPLQMPLATQKYQFPQLNNATYKGLPAVFADTLPDDFGNAVINAWLARKGRDSQSFSALERLLYTGKRGMGALEYAPALDNKNTPEENIELNSLVQMAQHIVDQRADSQLDKNQDAEMTALFHVGTSAGGARAKALIAINKARTQIRSGQTDAPDGFEHYLLKFDGVEEHKTNSEVFGDPKGFGRMEYAYYLMAIDAGITMAPSELLIEGQRAHFMTQRFDRIGKQKIHMTSLCAIDHADYKQAGSYSYEQLLSVARQLRLPRQDAIEIYRRMVFNVIARNHDDHTKNTAFLLTENSRQWRLAPAFDIAYSYKEDSPWVNAHQMSLNAKRDKFSKEDLLAVGSLIGNFKKQAQQIIDEVNAVVVDWQYYAGKAEVFAPFAKEIAQHHRLKI